MEVKEGKMPCPNHKGLLCVLFNHATMERPSLGIDFVDSDESGGKVMAMEDLDGEDNEVLTPKEEHVRLEECKSMVACGVLASCNSLASQLVRKKLKGEPSKDKPKLEFLDESNLSPSQSKKKKSLASKDSPRLKLLQVLHCKRWLRAKRNIMNCCMHGSAQPRQLYFMWSKPMRNG